MGLTADTKPAYISSQPMTNSRYGSHLPSLLNTVAYYCSQYFVKCRYNLSLPFTHFLMFLIIEGLARTVTP